MHLESRTYMAQALRRHGPRGATGTVLDVGAGGPGGVYRPLWEAAGWSYLGVDLGAGPDVDLVLPDPQVFPFADATFEAVISGQMLEHNPMFWLTFLEMSRVLRPGGLMVHIAPSRGREHRTPQDCWRFYRDGMHALAHWAGLDLVEATTDWQSSDVDHYARRRPVHAAKMRATARQLDTDWGDTVGVFRKPLLPIASGAEKYLSHFARHSLTGRRAAAQAHHLTQNILRAYHSGPHTDVAPVQG